MDSQSTEKNRKLVKMIFNPASGSNKESPAKLMNIMKELQAWKFIPEPYLTEPDSDFSVIVRNGIEQGIKTFIVCGGDGTVSAVARAMINTNATLGIIPTGTQNNIAFSLGIPVDIPGAISILKNGKRLKIDIGIATSGHKTMPFLELCSVGLFSTLFEPSDKIQHGDISQIGEWISTLTATTPSEINLLLNEKHEIKSTGHVVMISNMPYVGRHYQTGIQGSFRDGLLDVLFCSDLTKINLMTKYMLKKSGVYSNDSRIMNFQVRKISIKTQPDMDIMADGISLGKGSVDIQIRRRALSIIMPDQSFNKTDLGESYEQ